MKEQIEEYIVLWRRRLEEQEKYTEDVRKIKHDLQAHLIVLQYYLDEEKYESAKEYLKEIKARQSDVIITKEYDLGNPLVNVIVREALSKGEEIYLEWKGEIPEEIQVSDYDMCTIFSNLMSNAVEACNKISTTEKIINLDLFCKGDVFCIEMRNPVEWQINTEVFGKGTTKEDKASHGYGIPNIIDTVSRYNGECDFKIENYIFIAQISIPNVVNS